MSKPCFFLIAEDDEDDRLLIQEAFSEACPTARIEFANDGDELLTTLEARANEFPKVVLMDLNMPKRNGLEALGDLRRSETFAGLPVVMLTTSSNPDDIRKCKTAGADEFFTKPNSFSDLVELADRLAATWCTHERANQNGKLKS